MHYQKQRGYRRKVMKTALILFREPTGDNDGEYLNRIFSVFKGNGIPIDRVEMFSLTDDLAFKRCVENIKYTTENLIVISNPSVKFSIKQIIADIIESPLVENENAKKFLDAVCLAQGKTFPEEYAYIPMDATLIPNVTGAYQGFMADDKEFTLALFPNGIKEISVMADKYLAPYLEEKFHLRRKRITLKYMGDEEKLKNILDSAKEVTDCTFSYAIFENFGDIKVDLIFDNFNEDGGANALRYIVSELKDDIYAEYDVSLAERLFDILTLRNLKLSTAESFTSGKIASLVLENPGASKIFHEGIVCYSNKSKMERLNVTKEALLNDGAVSSKVAYQMALGLLRDSDCDIAITTTGIAGPKSDDTNKPVGLCFVAIGMRDGIHTYRMNLTGGREAITKKAINRAMFLAIKKLKNL